MQMLNVMKYLLTISTILDPRFKEKFFSHLDVVEELTSSLKDKVATLQASHSKDSSTDETEEPTSKRTKTTLLQCFSEILEEAGASVDDDSGNEIDRYISEPLIKFHGGKHCLNW